MIASSAGDRRAPTHRFPRRLALALLVMVHAAFGYWIVSTLISSSPRLPGAAATSVRATPAPTTSARTTASPATFAEVTGLKVLRVATSGAGGILDLRYRVVDEKKAGAHKNHQSMPAIIDAKTGTALTKQWMGHAHPPDSFQPDRNYWMLFLNPGELVERDDRVGVRLGHAVLTGVQVR